MFNSTAQPLYPWERPGSQCIRSWVTPRVGLDGRVKSRPLPGFDPRIVDPIANRYTHWPIPFHQCVKYVSRVCRALWHWCSVYLHGVVGGKTFRSNVTMPWRRKCYELPKRCKGRRVFSSIRSINSLMIRLHTYHITVSVCCLKMY
jgi:hypothetical protein